MFQKSLFSIKFSFELENSSTLHLKDNQSVITKNNKVDGIQRSRFSNQVQLIKPSSRRLEVDFAV